MYLNSNPMMQTRNHRPNEHRIQLPGASLPSSGQVIADLYHLEGPLTGQFQRSAVVADCRCLVAARRYATARNAATFFPPFAC